MRIEVSRRAERDLEALDLPTRNRILTALFQLQSDPRLVNLRKLKGTINQWRLRVGDYRVLLEISDDKIVATALRVKHRREVYR